MKNIDERANVEQGGTRSPTERNIERKVQGQRSFRSAEIRE